MKVYKVMQVGLDEEADSRLAQQILRKLFSAIFAAYMNSLIFEWLHCQYPYTAYSCACLGRFRGFGEGGYKFYNLKFTVSNGVYVGQLNTFDQH